VERFAPACGNLKHRARRLSAMSAEATFDARSDTGWKTLT
jgi:hypothetical protein